MVDIHPGTLREHIAAFDLDWTLVRTVHARFPRDEYDYAFLPHRISTLQAYYNAGYAIVIFTNQGYSGKKLDVARARITHILQDLQQHNILPWVYAAMGKNSEYRKPSALMWQDFASRVHVASAFYCGDAATDIEFAHNAGIEFRTLESVFPATEITIPNTQTMFIFVGMPGSGKSTYYSKYLQPRGWVHANQDELRTHARVLNVVKTALAQGKSVAVDATNATIAKRREFLDLARTYQVPSMILYFVANGYDRNKTRAHPVPDVAYNMYYKQLQEPSIASDGVPVVEML